MTYGPENAKPVEVEVMPFLGRQTLPLAPEYPAPAAGLWRTVKKCFKLGVCLMLDILDFTVGRILGFGIVFDIGCALIAVALWGHKGWWALLEVVDITEQLDGFVPTCTIIALTAWNDA